MGNNREIRISVVLLPDVTASTLLSVYDIFTTLPLLVPGTDSYRVTIVGESTEPVTTSCSVKLQAQASFAEIETTDIVIVPSLILRTPLWTSGKHTALVEWLRRQYAQGAVLCSACSGVFPLLETGLFDAEPITCHWYYENALRKSFPQVRLEMEKALIIAGPDQRFIMSGASASWHDLVLYLISRFSGPAVASACAHFFLLHWHPEGQAPYARFIEDTSHDDATIARAQAWIRQNWMQLNPIDELVRSSGLPERSFKRRFRKATGFAPIDYVQRLRIEQARQRLESSNEAVDTIAADIGYEDPAFFRKLFKRITRMTPSAYRLKFRTPYAR